MDTFGNAILGIVFLLLSAAGTFLMFHLWKYPFDREKLKSAAPPGLLRLHHFIGYAYALIYIYLMTQMLPRLWTYEVEFPARTVAHLTIGMAIGIILLVKVAVVRFFKHLESTLVPYLGTTLFVCTCLVIGLSVPFTLKEQYLQRKSVGGTAFSSENLERVKKLLPKAGFPHGTNLEDLASVSSLEAGRHVLLTKCVQCHDLRTVLIRPRTADNWVQTVIRMAERAVFDPISNEEQLSVATYLIAISPDLQKGVHEKMELMTKSAETKARLQEFAERTIPETSATIPFDLVTAKETFEVTCSQCHSLKNIDRSPPESAAEVRAVIARMVDNGLDAPQQELEQIVFYLTKTYVKQ